MRLIIKGFTIGMAIGAAKFGYILMDAVVTVASKSAYEFAKKHTKEEETVGDANVDDGK